MSAESVKAASDNPKPVGWRQLFRAVWTLWVPFFRDPATRLKAWALLLISLAFTALEVWVVLQVSRQAKDMNNALHNSDATAFWGAIKGLLCLSLGVAPFMFVHGLASGALALEWRRCLTNKLFAQYINSDQAFYRLKMQDADVDNPDQRIAQDVGEFTKTTVFLFEHFVHDVGTLVTSSFAVHQISATTCYMILAFSVSYTLIMLKGFASPLMRVQRRVLGLEADLRYILMRLRENAESIAFFQGARAERALSEFFLSRALRALYKKLCIEAGYRTFQGVMMHISFFGTFIPLAPMYFDGTLTFGAMSQAHMLFMHIEKSMFDFTKHLEHIAGLGAQALRIIELWDAIERYDKEHRHARKEAEDEEGASTSAGESSSDEFDAEGQCLTALDSEEEEEGNEEEEEEEAGEAKVRVIDLRDVGQERLIVGKLTLLPPVGEAPLLRKLSFTMCAEDSVLITGPSGTGKSTLLRTIGGLCARGSGVIRRTALRRSFFVPQNPYLYEGSLRDNVMYPSSTGGLSAAEKAQQNSTIRSILDSLGIGYLVDRHGLDEGMEFDKILSGGEKQRLNFARVLVRADLSFVLLDEATSALDEANENIAYGLLRQSVSCYMSVGHRGNLKKFHTEQLLLERAPDGGCAARLLKL